MSDPSTTDPTLIDPGPGPEDRFASAWQDGSPPPTLTEFLPREGDEGYLATLERLVRIEMEQTWRRASRAGSSRPQSLEDYLDRFPVLRTSEAILRLAQAEFAARAHAGDRPDPQSYVARFPAYFTTESAVERLIAEADVQAGQPISDGLGMLGDYRLLSQVGEGGMGVVYRAVQPGADRIVALKVIRSSVTSAGEAFRRKAETRFRNEIHAAAKLEHENIVPVYDVGSVGDLMYFAMRYVEGRSLHELVRQGPLDNRQAATYIAGTARGVAEAHTQGILHRDLKPQNVMIEGRSGRPMVADFGLAKLIDAEDQLTKTGETLGTPSYMPPEQISDAAAVDQRGDVYSLGATLYHLLTGRPPFQAASTLGTMRQVLYDEAVPPRQLNSTVDPDLETITLKCLQKEPARRYQSAQDFIDDIDRYLRGEPILARPIGRLERLIRWRRRHPAEAALTAAAIALTFVALAAIAIGYRNTRAALSEAEQNLAMAKSAVDELHTEVSEIDLENQPGLQPLKQKLLLKSLAYYQRLLQRRGRDVDLTSELADSYFRVGTITEEVTSVADAVTSYERAAEIQRSLLAGAPGNPVLLESLSNSLNSLGRARQRLQQFNEAQVAYDESRQLRQKLTSLAPGNREYQRKLANVIMNSGLLHVRRNKLESASADYADARQIRQLLLAQTEDDAVVRDFARGAFNQGTLARKQERTQEAIEHLQTAVTWFTKLVGQHPESLSDRFELAVASSLHGDLLAQQDDPNAALNAYTASRIALQTLVAENPQVVVYRERLATLTIGDAKLHVRLAVEALEEQPPREQQAASLLATADRRLAEGAAALEGVIQSEPGRAGPRYDFAVICQLQGEVKLAQLDTSAARTFWERGLEALEPLRARFSEIPDCETQWKVLEDCIRSVDTGADQAAQNADFFGATGGISGAASGAGTAEAVAEDAFAA